MCLLRKKYQNKFVTFNEFNTGESGQMFQIDLTRLTVIDASLGSIVKLREVGYVMLVSVMRVGYVL